MIRFFVNRPILASVLSIVILLLGGIAAGLLPVAEYPEVTKVGDESALWEWLSKVRDDGDGLIAPVRCAETGDIVSLDPSHTDAPIMEECRRDHWVLVHCTIETGMEVMHP